MPNTQLALDKFKKLYSLQKGKPIYKESPTLVIYWIYVQFINKLYENTYSQQNNCLSIEYGKEEITVLQHKQ